MEPKQLLLAEPRGMCAGVRRALELLEAALAENAGPVYVFNEIVHNRFIVENLKRRGVVFVSSPAVVPPGSTLIFSAHGVSREVEEQAQKQQLNIIDASCPLVKELHRRAEEAGRNGSAIILIGHAGHPEVTGILGRTGGSIYLVEHDGDLGRLPEFPPDASVLLLAQTTLDTTLVERLGKKLREKLPQLRDGGGTCRATAERQRAVRELAKKVELFIIIGSEKSSNSRRLQEVAARAGCPALLVDSAAEVPEERLAGVSRIGLGAGASAPDELLEELICILLKHGYELVEDKSTIPGSNPQLKKEKSV